jgi:hypothetical protein
MSIKKYTNIDSINSNSDNEGKFLQDKDLFILSKNEIEKIEFGQHKYDVMEVSVYDINNNILPHKSGNNVAYIKKGDIKNYLYSITNKSGNKELAINVEKLLNNLGFANGILKVNINFVKEKVGSENNLTKIWIQEISPSRTEIRILPLKTKDESINKNTKRQLKNLKSLNKDFIYYKSALLDSLNSFENTFLSKIQSNLETKFGKDFLNVLKKDFGLSQFDKFVKKIFEEFKTSVSYYLNNKYYDVTNSNFGKTSEIRFENDEVYDYDLLLNEIQNILNICILTNIKVLKRRNLEIKELPKEFQVTELRKQIKNNIEAFSTFTETKRNVYNPDKIDVVFNSKVNETPILPPPIADVIRLDPPANIRVGGGARNIRVGGGESGGSGGRNETQTSDMNDRGRVDQVYGPIPGFMKNNIK